MAEILRNWRLLHLQRELLLYTPFRQAACCRCFVTSFFGLVIRQTNYVAKISTAAERSPCVVIHCQGKDEYQQAADSGIAAIMNAFYDTNEC